MRRNILIKSYRKEGSNIIIKKTKGEKDRIFNTPDNEQKILKQMREDVLDALDDSLFDNCDKNIVHGKIITTLWSLAVIFGSYTLVRNSIDPSYVHSLNMPVYILDVGMFFIYSAILETKRYLSYFKEKYSSFFHRETELNRAVKEYPSLLDDVNKKAKEEIENNIADEMDNPINVNSIRLVKLKELKSMINKLEFYQDYDIETAQDVIDDYNGNLEELSKKYDSIEVEKPKKKKYLLER